jgi:hypothetical protein
MFVQVVNLNRSFGLKKNGFFNINMIATKVQMMESFFQQIHIGKKKR